MDNQNTQVNVGNHKTMLRIVSERFFEHRLAVVSLAVIICFVLVALGADVIAWALNLDPNDQDILSRYGSWSKENWLGIDEVGRDVFIRLVYGARISLVVAFCAATASMIIGVVIGAVAGYFGGWLDAFLMRLTDALLALPRLPVLIIMAAVDFGKLPVIGEIFDGADSSIVKMIIIFVVFSWMTIARLIRGAVLSLMEQDFVLSAKTLGMQDSKIIIKEILPNVLSPVIVSVTLSVGHTILFEAALSFLGLGIQPPTPSWGNMMTNALEAMYYLPSLVFLPGTLILIIVVSFNFLGDGLQDALDAKAIRR